MTRIITEGAKTRRADWVEQIVTISGHFEAVTCRIKEELESELDRCGVSALLDHLRLCSAIPESYGHDSSEEKLYSKYTDMLISAAYSHIGLTSVVLTERADSADVEAVAEAYGFVADAKVFRLSRTAKNQKDFKVQAMDNWKHGKPFAMIVCPLYHLPSRRSQIYEQAATHNVCILSFAHLAVLVCLAETEGTINVINLLHEVLQTVRAMNPSQDAMSYWQAVNRAILGYGGPTADLWQTEKIATIESIQISKELALSYYASKRAEIMNLSRDDAIRKLIDESKINSRVKVVNAQESNQLMDFV